MLTTLPVPRSHYYTIDLANNPPWLSPITVMLWLKNKGLFYSFTQASLAYLANDFRIILIIEGPDSMHSTVVPSGS